MTESEWEVLDLCGRIVREALYRLDPRLLLARPGWNGDLIDTALADALRHALAKLAKERAARMRMLAAPVTESAADFMAPARETPQPPVLG
jgi:hypothetical protein